MSTAQTALDKYLHEIERDTTNAEQCRAMAASSRRNGKLKDVTAHEQAAKAWDRHAAKHLAIVADLLRPEAEA